MDAISVIYIEDEEIEAQLFQLGFASWGIEVLHIPDTRPENLALLDMPQYQAAAAIFLDMWVGMMNGIELAQSLREKGDKRPIFLLTAGDNPNPAALKQLNVVYIQKPPDYGELAGIIKNL